MMVTNSQVHLLIGSRWTFFKEYPSLKPHILFYSDGLAIWHSLSDTPILKSIMASGRPFEFDRVYILLRISLTETAHLFYIMVELSGMACQILGLQVIYDR